MRFLKYLLMTLAALAPVAQAKQSDRDAFRDLYRELVETDTTLSNGNCTSAAEKMARRLVAGGIPAADVQVIVPPEFPRQGNLVAVYRGTDPRRTPILLLAHIDVVEAKRSEWQRDPFELIEEDGYFYARGASDDKAMAAAFVDNLIRYRQAGWRPRRSIKLALTCGEETDAVFNGVRYLLEHHRSTLDAGMALNEGGRGQLDEQGKRVVLGIQVGEKIYQDFTLTTTSPGGHSARPVRDNAIGRLAGGIARLTAFEFPPAIPEVTRAYFERMNIAADAAASNPLWNAMTRTTCVATQIEGGHAPNALPQSVRATVNCRVLPGHAIDDVRATLVRVLADSTISVEFAAPPESASTIPPLSPAVLDPARKVAARLWPGVPLVPALSTGATDGRFLNAAGIPTYGLSGMFIDPDGGGVHGLNERIRVRSLYEGREFLYEVVKLYAAQ